MALWPMFDHWDAAVMAWFSVAHSIDEPPVCAGRIAGINARKAGMGWMQGWHGMDARLLAWDGCKAPMQGSELEAWPRTFCTWR